MLARTRALGLFCAFAGGLASITAGCSSSRGSGTSTRDAGVQEGNHHPSSQMVKDDDEDDAGKSPNSDAGEAEEDAGNPCSATDDPDDDFADTNCDGIDGDKKKAVFVATTGSDTADGTWGKPVATLKHGIDLAITASKDVYVCAGVYAENLVVDSKSVRVYGGYDCTKGWVRNSNSQAQLMPASGYALTIKNATVSVVFDHVDMEAADARNPGESSVAVFVSKSSNVTLRRGTYRAGDGATAQASADVAAAKTSTVVPKPGNNAAKSSQCGVGTDPMPTCAAILVTSSYTLASPTSTTWNAQQTSTDMMYCPSGDYSYGGGGGGTNTSNCSVGLGTDGYPSATSGTLDGIDGSDGTAVAAATLGYGALNDSGYQASNQGEAGRAGVVGEGGTGGRGGGVYQSGQSCDVCSIFEAVPTAGGGQGGPGGCGGLGGMPGNAGGASIAIAIYQSNVTIERATVQTSKGGGGSPGGLGGDGAPGVKGGVSGTVNLCGKVSSDPSNKQIAQAGGNGGHGGHGSQGGPGGGGPSFPLFVSGTTPTLTAVTFLSGSGGPGGSNGGPRAVDGESADQKVLP